MTDVLAALWPLFILIVAGYAMRSVGFPGEEFWPGAERLNYFVLFPALLFGSLASAPPAGGAGGRAGLRASAAAAADGRRAILVLFFALPTAPTAYVLTRQLHGDSQLMAGVITLQTLLSAASLMVVLTIVT
jgi:predicted permease